MTRSKQRPALATPIRRSAWWTLIAGLLLACGAGHAEPTAGWLFEPGFQTGEPVLLASNKNNNNNQNQKRQDAQQEAAEQAWAQQQAQLQQQQQQQQQQQAEQEGEPLKPKRPPPPVPGVRVLAAQAGPPSPAQVAQQALQARQAQQAAQAQRDRQVQKLPPPPAQAAAVAEQAPPPPLPLTPSPGYQQQAQQAAAQQAAVQQAAAQQVAAQQAAAQQAAAQDARAFKSALVSPVTVDRTKPPSFNYKGQLRFDAKGNASLDPNGHLEGANGAASLVGRFLGGGANSKVYASTSSNARVKKMVYLGKSNDPGKIARAAQTLTDQDGGRAILDNIKAKMPDSPFRVAQRDGQLMTVKATDAKGEEHWFALSREENIASTVVVQDKTRPDYGSTVTVTDANARVQARAADKYGQKTLTAEEELTVNLVMRDLNQNGVVWTDHKLANFDIVADPTSATGHRVVFFDLDGFRPVRGNDSQQRYESAREAQRIFDSASDMGGLQSRLASFQSQKYPDGYGAFDFTAFGGGNLGWLATPGANKSRQSYNVLNNLSRENFAKTVNTFNAASNKNAQYVTPTRKS